jgi:hypothetical protein
MFSVVYKPSKTQFHSISFQNFWLVGLAEVTGGPWLGLFNTVHLATVRN